jgi:carbonic anhydrase
MARNAMADEALERLVAGNRRFVAGNRAYPDQTPAHLRELVAGQHPFAAILRCADSRVPPEIIFDQGLGDLLTVRVAGNIVDNASLGSLEYAVQHLGVPLVVVLGHCGCGAVQATMAGGQSQGQIATLVAAIQPAVEQSKTGPGETLDLALAHAVRINVAMVVRQLRTAALILAPLVEEGKIKILGAHYDLASGVVELLL